MLGLLGRSRTCGPSVCRLLETWMLAINSEIVAKAGKYIDILLLSRAYDNYQDDFAAGNDGNPAWLARKSCNYLTATTKVTIDYGI